jgi:hypothetical protein
LRELGGTTMKSVVAIFLLLIYVGACNRKSDEGEVSRRFSEQPTQMEVQTETEQKAQQKYETWDREPASVFGIPFGASKREVSKRFKLNACSKSTVMEICQFDHKLSNVNLRCTVAFSPKNGMQHVRASFSERDKEIVLSMLLKAYGRPHFTLPDAEAPAKPWGHDWRGKNVDVTIIGESFSITTKLFYKEIEESKKRQINSAAKEL